MLNKVIAMMHKEFQIKRHQAALKLDRTAEHMNEAQLLLAEITPRLKTLSRQMKKLEESQPLPVEEIHFYQKRIGELAVHQPAVKMRGLLKKDNAVVERWVMERLLDDIFAIEVNDA